jgi:methylenetetrahydrofolate reductase (NADPH)
MMHLTCTNITVESLRKALNDAKKAGIKNILALRGDPPKGQEEFKAIEGGFSNAVDLVKFIKQEHGDYFCVAVAGYPEGHLECDDKALDLQRLKDKIDAGGELVITQLFYDNDEFIAFVENARKIGITVPIIPGIMPIQSYGGFNRMTEFCKTKVPQHIRDSLEPIQHDEEKVKQYGIDLGV